MVKLKLLLWVWLLIKNKTIIRLKYTISLCLLKVIICIKNKTIIGLKYMMCILNIDNLEIKNKTIIGLKSGIAKDLIMM